MPTTTPVEHWRIPTLNDPADGPDALQKLALDAEASLTGADVSSYTPTWGATGDVQPFTPSAMIGRFRLQQKWCDVYIYLAFSASTGGGAGPLYLTLPVAALAGSRQPLNAFLDVPLVGFYHGFCRVDSGSPIMYPYFPRSETSNICQPWQSVNATHAAGTGVPLIPASWPIKAGGSIAISGTYLVA